MSVSFNRAMGRRVLRVVLVGTGTGVGKTHVACALLAEWAGSRRVVGLKPIETGIIVGRRRRGAEQSDQGRLTASAQMFHVKRAGGARALERGVSEAAIRSRLGEPRSFHVKQRVGVRPPISGRPRSLRAPIARVSAPHPQASLYTFPEPVSPHLAARDAAVRIDLGVIERWVEDHEAPVTLIETAGGLFSPLGHASTNFELTRAMHPDAVVLVAPDRLGVLHELTTTLALSAARGGLPIGVVLSAPEVPDASTGRNGAELEALGIAAPIATFPRRAMRHPATTNASRTVIAWIERLSGIHPAS
jgi:dethiobiotin synthetase